MRAVPDGAMALTFCHVQGNMWIIEGHVDNECVKIGSDDNGKEVCVRGCRGFNTQTIIHIQGAVRSVTIEDCKFSLICGRYIWYTDCIPRVRGYAFACG